MVKPVYTPLSLRDWVMAAPRHPLKPVDGLVCSRYCDRLRELHVSEGFTVIPETCEATAVKLIGVVVKRFTDICLFICVQFVELLQQR